MELDKNIFHFLLNSAFINLKELNLFFRACHSIIVH